MNALIPLHQDTIGTETIQTVNARELHAFLEVKARFNDWITRRIHSYGFEKGRDFTLLKNEYSQNQAFSDGPIEPIEYHISLDMAKELSMVERTKKGKEARLYFLECEKIAQMKPTLPEFHNPSTRALVETLVRMDALEHEVAEMRQVQAQTRLLAEHVSNNQQWTTLREYVYFNGLDHQVPPSLQKAFSLFLVGICTENNIPWRKQPVGGKAWETENSFHVDLVARYLPDWLTRQHAQITLVAKG